VKPGHAFVLGSGVAGLSLAELLSRNGWRITLIETAPELGGDASRCTQNWFHTGWLYAALPNKSAMLGCHRALGLYRQMYGHVLSNDILNLALGTRSPHYLPSARGWFSAERVHYLYATRTSELSLWQRLVWKRHVESVAFARLRALGYEAEVDGAVDPRLASLLNYWEGDDQGHRKYMVVRSTDAQINTRRVLDTLLGLLGSETEVVCGARYELSTRGDRTALHLDGETHVPDLLVMATGKSLAQQLASLGRPAVSRRLKSICSPVVVLRRALDLPSFIRFTPSLPSTVNHIQYEIEGVGVRSTLGSYDYYPAGETPDISPFANRICKRLGISPSEVADVYYGTKTELTGSLERRYNHALERVNANTLFAIAGKFSQFPLLAYELGGMLGLHTSVIAEQRGTLDRRVGSTAPERCYIPSTSAPSSLSTA
jgi:glycine/D-amino acid oxidase-like deaminating enzyme